MEAFTPHQIPSWMPIRGRRMATITMDPGFRRQVGSDCSQHGAVVEEIHGLIRVYKDGHVERPQIVPCVESLVPPKLGVTCGDIVIHKLTNVWARFYIPAGSCPAKKLPLLVYFHGGGFCVGSAAWSCYHDFLARLAAKAGCLIMSLNYRLAPENPLPAAYEDGFKALLWLKQEAVCSPHEWWSTACDFSSIFLVGDSAGANIAHHLATRLGSNSGKEATALKPLDFKGTILVQPFFGGEVRTDSEKQTLSPSVLSLTASDTYWRLSLPYDANRDHPWCNPMSKRAIKSLEETRLLPTLLCISEMDILKDRNLEYCRVLGSAGKRVEHFVYKGVGHAFQILNKSPLSQTRTLEMLSHIHTFITRRPLNPSNSL